MKLNFWQKDKPIEYVTLGDYVEELNKQLSVVMGSYDLEWSLVIIPSKGMPSFPTVEFRAWHTSRFLEKWVCKQATQGHAYAMERKEELPRLCGLIVRGIKHNLQTGPGANIKK